MTQQAGRSLTMQDLAAEMQWIRMLGWSDDQLRSVLVHEEATGGDEIINLSDFGGTALGVNPGSMGGASAGVGALRNMWVYKSETPGECWSQLQQLAAQGGPSGFNKLAQSGQTETDTFPPSGSSS